MKDISHSWELFEMVSMLLITVRKIEEFQKKRNIASMQLIAAKKKIYLCSFG